jgi:hypothetical protein
LEREGSSPERSGYVDYYTSDFTGERYSDQTLAGVDTEYGERAESQDRPSVGTGDRVHGDLGQPPLGTEETAGPRNDLAGTGQAARTEGAPRHDSEAQETASVRVHKRGRKRAPRG